MKKGVCSNCGVETGVCTHCYKCAKCCECEKIFGKGHVGKINGKLRKKEYS